MSSFEQEQPVEAPTFLPVTDEPPDPLDALTALQSAQDTFTSSPDLIVAEEPPPPIGRSWAYDWQERRFHSAGRSSSPAPVRGLTTLRGWIEKCLRTQRGAHPIHPAGYGLVGDTGIGGPVGVVPADLEQRVRDALTFHPRITDVSGFSYDHDPDDDYLAVTFDVELDGGEVLAVNNLQLGL